MSVIIPTYNRAHLIGRTIESAIQQTYHPIEVLIIDDGSKDNTEEVVKRYPEVKYFKQPNQGVSVARNYGVSLAKGEYIAFLDSDDCWVYKKLELQMALIQKLNTSILGSRKKYILEGKKVNLTPTNINSGYHYISFKRQLKRTWFSPCTIIIKKDFFQSFSGFDTHLKIAEDWDLWLKIANQQPIPRMNAPLAYCYITGNGLTENRLEKYLNDLAVIKKWDPKEGGNITPSLYQKWCSSFALARLFKLLRKTNKDDAKFFWDQVKTELPVPMITAKIGDFWVH